MEQHEQNLCRFSEEITCEIPMRLPSLNDYIRACRNNKYNGANMKKKIENDLGWYLSELPKFENPIEIDFHWIEGNKTITHDSSPFILAISIRVFCISM